MENTTQILYKGLIRRIESFDLNIISQNEILVSLNGKSQKFSNRVLDILSCFKEPLSLENVLLKLSISSKQDWINVNQIIRRLLIIDVLRYDNSTFLMPDKDHESFGSAAIHIKMLNDKARTLAFLNAISEVVKNGDVVVDIGTGTGVLALAAAKAGAKKVYAIEQGAMADAAKLIFEMSGFGNVITLLRGLSTEIELPEKVDVLISEIIGNDPFSENILPVFLDARKRFLKPNAQIIPNNLDVFATPVELAENHLQDAILNYKDLENWKNWYNIDFTPLLQMRKESVYFKLLNSPINNNLVKIKADSILLANIDLAVFTDLFIRNSIRFESSQSFNGLMLHFNAKVGSKAITNHPLLADKFNHWLCPVWYFKNAKENTKFNLEYSYTGLNNSEIKLDEILE